MLRTITWDDALAAAKKIVPGCSILIPDPIADAAKANGLSVVFHPIPEWESLSDDEMLSIVGLCDGDSDEIVIAVTDESFGPRTPFIFKLIERSEFCLAHRDRFGMIVFDGDAVFILPESRRILLLHHSGFYCRLQG